MACYGDSFTSLSVDDVLTSQETHARTYMACYGDSFSFLISHSPVKHLMGLGL
jgi:hypothetical protein